MTLVKKNIVINNTHSETSDSEQVIASNILCNEICFTNCLMMLPHQKTVIKAHNTNKSYIKSMK